jgi:hypothetical protein
MADDWMHIMIEVPAEEGSALLQMLQEKAGFREVDWCELQRPDFSRVSYGPSEPRTSSGFTIPPFPAKPVNDEKAVGTREEAQ